MTKIDILGISIDNINKEQAINKIESFLNLNKQHYIVTPNPEIILESQKNDNLKQIINKADLKLPDGFGLILASKFKLKMRVTGTDVMMDIINLYKNKKFKFVINEAGLTSIQDLNRITKEKKIIIDSKNPDIIFVALGCPKQEKWIQNNINKYPNTKLFMTVGGGVDFLTNRQQRAPKIIQNVGLEWLWRLFKQPKRIKRIINAVIIFPLKVFTTKFY